MIVTLLIAILVLLGALVGLTYVSNVTGNAITGSAVELTTYESETFKINDNINEVEVDDGSLNNG